MTIKQFVEKYKTEAFAVDFKSAAPWPYRILNEKKMLLEDADTNAEVEGIKRFCEDAILETKKAIGKAIENESYLHRHLNHVPNHVLQVRTYFEYRDLLEKTRVMTSTTATIASGLNGITMKQVALIHVYTNGSITRDSAKLLATSNGWKSKTSGEALFHDLTYYSSRANRRADPGTLKRLRNKIELFEIVLSKLGDSYKPILLEEIEHLKGFESKY